MFRKTITHLAYSPALAEELANYARKLRHEVTKRQIGLIFIVLALIIQLFAVLFPPESANAGNTTDFIEGGFSTIDEYLGYYDQNTHDIRELLTSLGISRGDIRAMQTAKLESRAELLVWKMASRGSADDTAYDFLKSDGTTRTAYFQPLRLNNNSSYKNLLNSSEAAYVGLSSSAGWFALQKSSGNLITRAVASRECNPDATYSADTPVPVSLKDSGRCDIKLIPTLSAQNLSTGTPAASHAANASNRLVYTLAVTNNDTRNVSVPLSIGLADLLEYAQLMDKGGADFNQETKTLTWATAAIPPGGSLKRSFIVKLLPVIPSTATGQIDASSFDCVISTSFGRTLHIPVACPLPKVVEQVASSLPAASLPVNLVSAVLVTIIAAYFYARSRQLNTELRLIRHNYQGNL